MANTLLTNDIIADAFLASFVNSLSLSMTANINYAGEFESGRGGTLRIPNPIRYTVRSGATYSAQDVTETNESLVVGTQRGVDVEFTSAQLTLSLRDFSKSVLEPAAQRLATEVESQGISTMLAAAYHKAGTAGTAVNSFTTLNQARAMLKKVGVMGQYATLNPDDSVALQGALQNSFNEVLNKEISMDARIGRLASLDVFESSFTMAHTAGAQGGTPLVNGASQTGSSLVTDGWTASVTDVLKQGDMFTLAGVNSVNPVDQSDTGTLQVFLVTADANSDGSGNATFSISPSITTSGAYKTVTASPADNAAITVVSGTASATNNNNFVYHKDGICLGWADLVLPNGKGAYAKRVKHPECPISVRMVQDYDISDDKTKTRFDVYFGWLCNPEYVVRLLGA